METGPDPEAAPVEWFAARFDALTANIETFIRGKTAAVRAALVCIFAEGHLLIDDVPGVGKTSLAKALAASIGATMRRIQFTPDLLPTDVTGVQVFDERTRQFEFRPGPVFANVVLADEINRASPKTQSALLEVMEEGRVTVDGVSRPVGRPFMVIATQNPIEQAGTYRLPEAQLDRFLMKTSVGYPDREATIELLVNAMVRDRASLVTPVITSETIGQMSGLADDVYVDPAVIGYVAELAEESRTQPHVKLGLSARGCLAFIRVAKTWAAADGRDHVVPDDVRALAEPVLSHRLLLDAEAQFSGVTVETVIGRLLDSVAPPTDRVA
jgi:MoxR-like ATPase